MLALVHRVISERQSQVQHCMTVPPSVRLKVCDPSRLPVCKLPCTLCHIGRRGMPMANEGAVRDGICGT